MHPMPWLPRHLIGRLAIRALVLALLLTACGVPIDIPIDVTPEPFPSGVGTTAPALDQTTGRPPTASVPRTPLPARTPEPAVAPIATIDGTSAACGYAIEPSSTPSPSRAPFAELPSGRLISSTGVRPARPFVASPLIQDANLESLLLSTLGDDRDNYAVLVQDLSNGRGATVNAERIFYAASVFKITVMYEVFNQISQGLLSLDDLVVITPYYEAFGLGPRTTGQCETLTLAEAMYAMMSISDNAVAVLLQDLVGSNAVNASMEALGLTETRLLEDDLPLTAADVALLLDGIAHGDAVSKDASQEMLSLLASERIDNGARAGVPAGTLVAHKTGNWSNATHDVGIIYAPNATYLFVVLSETNHENRVILALSKAVYEYFAKTP